MPTVAVSPDLLLLGVLPPLLFWHGFIVTPREIRANAPAIGLLAVVLVVLTVAMVALASRITADISWAAAIALGAMVGPTDPVAFLTVARRLGVSPRLVGLLDGENLLNDFTAITVYVVAVEAATTGAFSAPGAGLLFVLSALAGIMIGLAVGALGSAINSRVDDPSTAPIIALAAAYLAFLPAEALHVSAILAAGAAGRVMGWRSPIVDRPHTRLSGYAFWNTGSFLLTAVLFMLVGLQLPVILDALADRPVGTLLAVGLAAVAAVVLTRIAWLFLIASAVPTVGRSMRLDQQRPWAEAAVVGWSGMRGALSVALALALPSGFPDRDLVVFLTFTVVIVTLVGQGLTLPALIRRLPLERDSTSVSESQLVRRAAARAALDQLERLARRNTFEPDAITEARTFYHERLRAHEGTRTHPSTQELTGQLIDAERRAATTLRKDSLIGDDVLREYERELDMRAVLVTVH